MNSIKRLLFVILPENLFFLALQRVYWLLYRIGLLKNSEVFKYHYFIRKIIQPTDHVVDIGANLGYFSMPFSWLCRSGRLDAIEPLPMYSEALERVFKRHRHVHVHNVALGTTAGKVTMELPYEQGVLRTGLPHVVTDTDSSPSGARRVTVDMESTEEFFNRFTKIDYLKCDVEGYEWEIFKNLESTLQRTRPIVQVEIAGHNVPAMCDLMQRLGYAQFGVTKGKCIPDSIPQREEGDYLFIPLEKTHLVASWNK
jgi:FkbM family methyltransferase